VNFFRWPLRHFASFANVFCHLLEIFGVPAVEDFDDGKFLTAEPSPFLRNFLHVQPADVQEPVGVQMPTCTFVRDFDGDASPQNFFPAFQTADFGQIFLMGAESGRREDWKIFLRENEVFWLRDTFDPDREHLAPAFRDFSTDTGDTILSCKRIRIAQRFDILGRF